MELREKYEKENGHNVYAYRQDYAGARPYQDGFNDEYVEWLESKVKNLSLCAVSQRSELLLDYTKQLKKQGTLTSGQDEIKLVKKFLSNNCG